MLSDIYSSLVSCAKQIPGFVVGQKEDVPYDITQLANSYCDAIDNNDETKKNQYISALIIRYWHMVSKLYESSKTLRVDREDIVDWLYQSIDKACSYRSWLDPKKPISKQTKGAEKCINQCITSVRAWWFKHYNQDVRVVNQITTSLNIPCTEYENTSLLDMQSSFDKTPYDKELIRSLIKKGSLFDAIILDGIINQDTFIQKSKECKYTYEDENGELVKSKISKNEYSFSKAKLSSHVKNLSTDFITYFSTKYKVEESDLIKEIESLKICDSKKIYHKVMKSLKLLQTNKEVINYVRGLN